MISSWMLHSLAVAALVGLSALALERALLALGRPTRGAWAGALALSVLLPLLAVLLPGGTGAAGGAVTLDLAGAEILAAAPAADADAGVRLWAERALAAGWLLGSAGLLAGMGLSLLSLERERRRWRHRVLGGRAVLVSADTGPAVMGFLWPEIVVPRWVLDCDEGTQRLLLTHEREHQRAGDPHLLLGALVVLVLMPWNLPLWWQVRRLRLAVEVDCDARVLRELPHPRAYGLLLLEVGRRASRVSLPAAAFGEPRSLLERRLRLLADPRRPGRRAGVALALAAAAGLVLACELPDPAGPELGPLLPSDPPPAASAPVEGWTPTPTPYQVKPELVNREEFGRTLEGAYPPVLRDAGIGGSVMAWVFITETGEVGEVKVSASSGYPELDEAARTALLVARFSPARNEGAAVPVWIQLPVVFQVANPAPRPERVEVPVWSAPGGAEPPAAPTPLEIRPRLANRQEFAAQMESAYPPALRDAGIGGRVVLWVHIDARGVVTETGVARTSGRAELDAAAREVMLRARFSPPRAGGRAVDAWIQLPVMFQTR